MIPLSGEMSAQQTKGCLNSENFHPRPARAAARQIAQVVGLLLSFSDPVAAACKLFVGALQSKNITKIILQIFFRINFQRVIFNIFPRAFPFCLVADYMVIKTALPKRFLRFSRHFKKPLRGVRLQSSNNIGKR